MFQLNFLIKFNLLVTLCHKNSQGRIQDLSEGVARFFRNKKLIIRNKIKGLGQGFRNNKKIVQELETKLKD